MSKDIRGVWKRATRTERENQGESIWGPSDMISKDITSQHVLKLNRENKLTDGEGSFNAHKIQRTHLKCQGICQQTDSKPNNTLFPCLAIINFQYY